mgnify:CR=1 FL=1|tara:strand:- start:1440 stop:3611 length:2172 start_codon:yes stop_codon:yes gene_type:complete
MANRLGLEPSPYLLQHANNPVDWYPWGEEAFTCAREQDRPIFLSVGYSTCHWCHVMEHESFEDQDIAQLLNSHFVAVKVDREERPDLDRVYMAFVQATTGSGGWPMSVWLTPERQPFFGGTYFPPRSRSGRPGFFEILTEISKRWHESRDELVKSAIGMTERLRSIQGSGQQGGPGHIPDLEILTAGVREYAGTFDHHAGGFGQAPKFPRPAELFFLLCEYARVGDVEARHMVLETLRAMALGGIRDHVGGGFHRYSVDAAWRVPHFEKMLYDQAQLAIAFLETSQAASEPSFAEVALDTLAYVRRELTHPDGGFFSAEDADSVPPGLTGGSNQPKTEGAFYVWGHAEIEQLFGEGAEVIQLRYGIEVEGNALEDPHGEFTGKNILYLGHGIDDVARLSGRSTEAVVAVLDSARAKLFEARAVRQRPHLDDKVLASWNGLMIAAFARAARVRPLDDTIEALPVETATRAAQFLRERLWNSDRGILYRRFRDGRADIDGFAEDYAFVIWGLLELFQAGGDPTWLDWAKQLQQVQDRLFWDDVDGGWFTTSGADQTVLLRLKEDYDGAEPSAGSVSVLNLLTLAHLSGPDDAGQYRDRVDRTLRRLPVSPQLSRVVPMMMAAASIHESRVSQLIILGSRSAASTVALQRVFAESFMPGSVSLVVEPGVHQDAVADRMPWVAEMHQVNGQSTAYLCQDFACQAPVTDPEALRAQLGTVTAHRSSAG